MATRRCSSIEGVERPFGRTHLFGGRSPTRRSQTFDDPIAVSIRPRGPQPTASKGLAGSMVCLGLGSAALLHRRLLVQPIDERLDRCHQVRHRELVSAPFAFRPGFAELANDPVGHPERVSEARRGEAFVAVG